MIKHILKGITTYIPGAYSAFSRKQTGGTDSARYCYSVWLRFMVMASKYDLSTCPGVVAELGPGDSIGIGLAALISGVSKYFALDVIDYANPERNLEIFDKLVEMFKNREAIPGVDEFPGVIPYLDSYVFPDYILTSERLKQALDDDRLRLIRQFIINTNESTSMIQYKVPWNDADIIEKDSIDMIFSQAVLEHVDEPEFAYRQMYSWLKPGSFMAHSIDFRSHGFADDWNGLTWKLVKGSRRYTLNRLPHSRHLSLMSELGFNVRCDLINRMSSTIGIEDIAPRFRSMDESDLTASTAFIQAVK